MVRLERWLALPLYASAAWLVLVLSRHVGIEGAAAAVAGLVLIALAAWLYDFSRRAIAARRHVATGVVGALVLAAVALSPVAGAVTAPARPRAAADGAFSPRRLDELRRQGRPVFVNVTAAWCITCLVNERVALSSAAVARAFADKGVVHLTADWTNRDPAITAVLGAFGRSGVPLYLLYPPAGAGRPAGEPTVLPQILSESAVIEALHRI